MTSIDNTLAERGKRYGEFPTHAEITQGLKEVMWATPNWEALADDQKEALEMTAHKIGRILNGDPNYIDSWTDIGGYVRLVEKRLMDTAKPAEDEGVDEVDPLIEFIESAIGKSAVKRDTLDEKLTAILKRTFGDDIEVRHIRG